MKRYKIVREIKPPDKPVEIIPVSQPNLTTVMDDPIVECIVHPSECTDYVVPKNGLARVNVKSVSINGFDYHLTPGKNMVPLSVRNIMDESRQRAVEAKKLKRIDPFVANQMSNSLNGTVAASIMEQIQHERDKRTSF